MANSLNALLLQFLLMFLAAILFASLIYFVEQGEWDDEQGLWIYPEGSSTADGEASAFASIVKGLWWCITTITTVGYGDMFPRTPGGKLVAICTFGAGLLSIAVPVAVVASNFSEQYEERKTKKDLAGALMAGNVFTIFLFSLFATPLSAALYRAHGVGQVSTCLLALVGVVGIPSVAIVAQYMEAPPRGCLSLLAAQGITPRKRPPARRRCAEEDTTWRTVEDARLTA